MTTPFLVIPEKNYFLQNMHTVMPCVVYLCESFISILQALPTASDETLEYMGKIGRCHTPTKNSKASIVSVKTTSM